MRLAVAFAVAGSVVLQQQQPPVIRSQITLVPVDVRVIGSDGRPVLNLTEADFEIFEDGVRQEIRHFSAHTFTPDPALAVGSQPEFRTSLEEKAAAPNRRVFLIVLGRGRHNDVSGYVTELERFIRERVLPQDQVALMAWNRATDFTTDHKKIVAILNRYRAEHAKVESHLRLWFSGLRALYGSKAVPPHLQREIDDVFSAGVALRPRELMPSAASDDAKRLEKTRNEVELAAEETRRRADPQSTRISDLRGQILADLMGMSFDEYVDQAAETLNDLGSLYAAIDYLRFLDGEKHLLFVTERGLYMPLLPGNRGLAMIAADARIALSVLQTGGTAGGTAANAHFNQGFSIRDLREIAGVSGGEMMAFQKAGEAFDRFERAIGSQYVLAYAPSRPAVDGKFRNIEVKVKREGARVVHRGGYFASPSLIPMDRREFITQARIRAAGDYAGNVDHIKVRVPGARQISESPRIVEVQIEVDLARVALRDDGARKVGEIDVAVLCADSNGKQVGQRVDRVTLRFDAAMLDATRQRRQPLTARVPVTAPARHVRVIVYDYGADLLGSASYKIQ